MEAGYVLHFLTQRSVMGEGLSGGNKPISDNQSNINISTKQFIWYKVLFLIIFFFAYVIIFFTPQRKHVQCRDFIAIFQKKIFGKCNFQIDNLMRFKLSNESSYDKLLCSKSCSLNLMDLCWRFYTPRNFFCNIMLIILLDK